MQKTMEESLFWMIFGVMCICVVALGQSATIAATVGAIIIVIMLAVHFGNRRELFGDTVYMCADGGETCPPKEPNVGANGLDDEAIAELPLKKCDLYLTDNMGECDNGLYEMHILEMKERRKNLESSPVANSVEIERLDRVLMDAARLPRRQCKLTMANWVRPYHSSFPLLKSMKDDFGPRGNPRHWAYCFAPMDRDNSLDFLKQGLERNDDKNGSTVMRSGVQVKLSNQVENERVEFSTLNPEDMRKTYCNFFYPARDEKIMSYYQMFQAHAQNKFFTIDMTPSGVIRDIKIYTWSKGYLSLLPKSATQNIMTCQDNLSSIQSFNQNMPEVPDRFNIEMAFYCSDKPLFKLFTRYRWLIRQLYTEVVSGNKLFYQLKESATVYTFNINICDRVDRITPMQGNLMQMLGNAATQSTVVHWNSGATQDELCNKKAAKRAEVCDVAMKMNETYTVLQRIYADQKRYGEDYRSYSRPDTNEKIIMTPETARLVPVFQQLLRDQINNERKFQELTNQKRSAVSEIRKINGWLMEIETNINNVIDSMMVKVRGKLIAIPVKPYQYISNDGRVYFQMAA
jgi:hypothetical protein